MPPVSPLMMKPPMGSSGPASPPTANPGLMADASSKVREAIKLLEMALPSLPTGSETHKAVIDMLSKGSKAFPATEEVPGIQDTQLKGLADQAKKSAMIQALMRQSGAGAGPPGMGASPLGGPPAGAMPPPAEQPEGA